MICPEKVTEGSATEKDAVKKLYAWFVTYIGNSQKVALAKLDQYGQIIYY